MGTCACPAEAFSCQEKCHDSPLLSPLDSAPCPVGLVLEPLPTGAWAFLAVTVTIFTKTLSFQQAFIAFQNDVIWLIVVSFFFAAVRKGAAPP